LIGSNSSDHFRISGEAEFLAAGGGNKIPVVLFFISSAGAGTFSTQGHVFIRIDTKPYVPLSVWSRGRVRHPTNSNPCRRRLLQKYSRTTESRLNNPPGLNFGYFQGHRIGIFAAHIRNALKPQGRSLPIPIHTSVFLASTQEADFERGTYSYLAKEARVWRQKLHFSRIRLRGAHKQVCILSGDLSEIDGAEKSKFGQ